MSIVRASVWAVAVITTLGLVGCAAEPMTPSESAPPSAPATPVEAPAVVPEPGLPVACADLLTSDEVQAQVVEPVRVRIDGSTPPRGYRLTAFAQAGGTRCVWAGQARTDASYDDGLEVAILPRSSADFRTAETDGSFAGRTPAGELPDSYVQCDTVHALCLADVLVGDYWLNAVFSDSGRRDADASAHGRTAIVMLLESLVAKITSAPAERPAWVPPRTGSAICPAVAGAASSLGLAGDAATDPSEGAPLLRPEDAAVRRLAVEYCRWPDQLFTRRCVGVSRTGAERRGAPGCRRRCVRGRGPGARIHRLRRRLHRVVGARRGPRRGG